MLFKSYNDIENAYNSKFITLLRNNNCDNEDIKYVCEVKIDGSNFQLSIDFEDKFQQGSRSQLLDPRADFQGASLRALRNQNIEAKLRNLKDIIRHEFASKYEMVSANNFTLTVYGELCGGMYRHSDVESVKGAKKIQGRVSYHPDNVWIPFDIVLRTAENETIHRFGPYEAKKLLESVDLPYTIILFEGTFDECLAYQNDFMDPIGEQLFNLPKIENNITEGVVIKPVIPTYIGNERVIIKNKNEKFKEKTHKTPKAPKEELKLNELELKYFNIMCEYITESRLMSVFSKLDNLTEKSFGLVLGNFMKDLMNDFEKEYLDEIHELEAKLTIDEFNLANSRKFLSKEISEFIRPLFLEKINS